MCESEERVEEVLEGVELGCPGEAGHESVFDAELVVVVAAGVCACCDPHKELVNFGVIPFGEHVLVEEVEEEGAEP